MQSERILYGIPAVVQSLDKERPVEELAFDHVRGQGTMSSFTHDYIRHREGTKLLPENVELAIGLADSLGSYAQQVAAEHPEGISHVAASVRGWLEAISAIAEPRANNAKTDKERELEKNLKAALATRKGVISRKLGKVARANS